MSFTPSGVYAGRDSTKRPIGPPVLDKNFAPSRGRNVAALAATAVAGSQPVCRALPSLIVGKPDSPAEHVRAACSAAPVASLINLALSTRVRNLLSSHLQGPAGTIARRPRALSTFHEVDLKPTAYRSKWAAKIPPMSPAKAINRPILHLLVRRFDYPDASIANDIAGGMPISGDVPVCDTLKPREKPATMAEDEWIATRPQRNANAIDRVQRFRRTELGSEFWRKSLTEISSGLLSQPVPLTPQMAVTVNITPRYAIFEQHGTGPRKVRIIDDLKASGGKRDHYYPRYGRARLT